uniref:Glutaredoxin n=1 Tax=Inkyuleea mariana TaxID=123988 RepID=A0A4D6WZJ6_9FLOR|nr:hypothetical protein [Inkyuleea mariana]
MKNNLEQNLKNLIKKHKVIIFIKGEKLQPMCKFSQIVIKILNSFNIDYHTVNVLKDKQIKENIKNYSKWPTIPQVYIDNEFIGGADILLELYNSSELQEKLEKVFNH